MADGQNPVACMCCTLDTVSRSGVGDGRSPVGSMVVVEDGPFIAVVRPGRLLQYSVSAFQLATSPAWARCVSAPEGLPVGRRPSSEPADLPS